MNLYAQDLLDHYKHPRNRGELTIFDFKTEEYNPSCGDKIQFFAVLDNNTIKELMFVGFGCVISQATASIITEYAKDKNLNDLLALTTNDLTQLVKIDLGPTRLKCALLSLFALQKGIRTHLGIES